MSEVSKNSNKPRGCVRVGMWLVAGWILLVILLSIVGRALEARAAASFDETYPPPGEIVTVDGRDMHLLCEGEGSPTIILDAGQGGWSSDWGDFIPGLSADNRVCAYDRAGYGWSDPTLEDVTPRTQADDLAALLDAAGVEGPYLLVGFSHAGLHDRLFAADHADQMAGLVLVDPATEFDNDLLGEDLRQQQDATVGLFRGFEALAGLGVIRMMGPENMAGSAPFIGTDPANPEIYYEFVASAQWWETSIAEFESRLDDDLLALVAEEGTLPDIPVVIIASDEIESVGNADMDAVQQARREQLQALADEAPQGTFIVAEGSGHNVLADRPDVVLEAIQLVLNTD